MIDLKGIAFDAGTSWTYYDSDGSDTGGTLTIYENIDGTATAVDSIKFGNGDYTTESFVLTERRQRGNSDRRSGDFRLGNSDRCGQWRQYAYRNGSKRHFCV